MSDCLTAKLQREFLREDLTDCIVFMEFKGLDRNELDKMTEVPVKVAVRVRCYENQRTDLTYLGNH